MELNRNQFFMIGLVLMMLGIQFRMVESYTLNEKTSRFLAERMQSDSVGEGMVRPFMAAFGPMPRKTIKPPEWLGWATVSVASVLILHALAMKKPGG